MITKSDFKSEYEWLEHCAENGISEMQITFASEILAKRTDEKRVVDAYKWLFISLFLENIQGKDSAVLVPHDLTLVKLVTDSFFKRGLVTLSYPLSEKF